MPPFRTCAAIVFSTRGSSVAARRNAGGEADKNVSYRIANDSSVAAGETERGEDGASRELRTHPARDLAQLPRRRQGDGFVVRIARQNKFVGASSERASPRSSAARERCSSTPTDADCGGAVS